MVELFGHIRMIFERDKPRLALEAGFQKFVQPFNGDAEIFLSSVLEPVADAFLLLGDLARVKKLYGPDAARAVASLQRIDNKDWMPPGLLRIWKAENGDNEAVAIFLIALERAAYYLFVTRQGINARIERFSAVMDELYPRMDTIGTKSGLSLSPQEQIQFGDALAGPLYEKVRVCKPVLQRLDEALSSGGATYDELVSLEHVLPQTVEPTSEWALLFPDEGERSRWTHRIANLVFLTQRINSRASNWSFDKKKAEYFASEDGSSPFVITQGVLQTDGWTPEHLGVRQKKLLMKLANLWNLEHWEIETIEFEGKSYSGFEDGGGEVGPGTLGATDRELLDKKRGQIMSALAHREAVTFLKEGAAYTSKEGDLRAVCAVSKRYGPGRAPYWYGYTVPRRDFLLKGKKAFLVLGCMDRNRAYAVPASEMEKVLSGLHSTPDKHWHIALEENTSGALDMVLRSGAKVELKKFEIGFG